MIQPARRHLTLALLLALATAACSSGSKNSPVGDTSGADLYGTHCAQCHGKTGKGSFLKLGPSYEGIAKFWDKASLVEYIADPAAYSAKVERLGKRPMTAVADSVTAQERERLVEHALSLMD